MCVWMIDGGKRRDAGPMPSATPHSVLGAQRGEEEAGADAVRLPVGQGGRGGWGGGINEGLAVLGGLGCRRLEGWPGVPRTPPPLATKQPLPAAAGGAQGQGHPGIPAVARAQSRDKQKARGGSYTVTQPTPCSCWICVSPNRDARPEHGGFSIHPSTHPSTPSRNPTLPTAPCRAPPPPPPPATSSPSLPVRRPPPPSSYSSTSTTNSNTSSRRHPPHPPTHPLPCPPPWKQSSSPASSPSSEKPPSRPSNRPLWWWWGWVGWAPTRRICWSGAASSG